MDSSKGIYKITSPRGSVYIGMTTVSFLERWKQHLKQLRSGSHTCTGLKRAFAKYGQDGLTFEILEVLDYHSVDEIMQREIYWWDFHKNQQINIYNGKPTGTGSVIHTEETKRKLALAQTEVARFRGDVIWSENKIICPTCKQIFYGRPRIYCSNKCSQRDPEKCKIEYITKDSLISEIKNGGSYLDISERLGIKKSSFYTLMKRYKLSLNEVRNM